MVTKNEHSDSWNKKSWINDLANDLVLAKDLTERYAEDVLEAVGEDYFPSLDDAIADLAQRTGLNIKEAAGIKRVAIAMVKAADGDGGCPCGGKAVCDCKEDEVKTAGADSKVVTAFTSEEIAEQKKKTPNASMPEIFKALSKSNKAKGESPTGDVMEKTEFKADVDEKEESDCEAFSKVDIVRAAKSNKLSVIKAELKDNAEAIEYINKVEAWFQGADETSVDGDKNTSNDPEKLGYPGEVMYKDQGTDPRMIEKKDYEGAANQTKKEMGPSGEELKLKELMQRTNLRTERVKSAFAKALATIEAKKKKKKMDKTKLKPVKKKLKNKKKK